MLPVALMVAKGVVWVGNVCEIPASLSRLVFYILEEHHVSVT